MKRVYLLAKPKRAPKWWPRNNGRPVWVYVFRDGDGWTAAWPQEMTTRQARKARRIFEDGQDYQFNFRTEEVEVEECDSV